jgi:uncharacterized membrane protein YphA (DoxX/SURF4 family)
MNRAFTRAKVDIVCPPSPPSILPDTVLGMTVAQPAGGTLGLHLKRVAAATRGPRGPDLCCTFCNFTLPERTVVELPATPTLAPMKTKATQGARMLLGLIFFVFGLNGFFHFIPQPSMSGPPGNVLGALVATGYFFPLLKLTEVAAGALLLSGLLVPLALTVLAPVIVNIVAFHSFLAPSGLPVPIVVGRRCRRQGARLNLPQEPRPASARCRRASNGPDARSARPDDDRPGQEWRWHLGLCSQRRF